MPSDIFCPRCGEARLYRNHDDCAFWNCSGCLGRVMLIFMPEDIEVEDREVSDAELLLLDARVNELARKLGIDVEVSL